ncbi:MAG: TIM barrel protein [Clostridia bacterium]|nr:TIM barrel protein [Clostridia bacterium]
MSAKFGPAGNGDAFYAAGFKSTAEAPAWLHAMGLTAYEYQCGRGVRLSDATAASLRKAAEQHDVTLSLHAPYFISLASAEEEKRDNSIRYILDSADAVARLGGDRIVVHPGGLGGRTREEATALACDTLCRAQKALDDAGLCTVRICPETMGKINQLGDLEEILQMCLVDDRLLPTIDFGHLNSRTHGAVNDRAAFAAILDRIRNVLGEERGRIFHAHFSKIEYTAGGEKRHLTFADEAFGPEPLPLMELLAERDLSPTVICESDGTQAEDAKAMSDLYAAAKQKEV